MENIGIGELRSNPVADQCLKCFALYTELSETQNYAYWYACFFPGTHDFR